MNVLSGKREGPFECLTVLYLAFPVLIFILGWVRWEIAYPVVLLALAGLWSGFFSETDFKEGWRNLLPSPAIFILIAALVWISGAADCFAQRPDWLKHNSLLFDLVHRPWPVFFEGPDGALPLVYYVAYYLPAALVGKCFGMTAAFAALFAWTTFGFLLLAAWLKILVFGKHSSWVTIAFLLFSGLDLVGNAVYHAIYAWFLHDSTFPWYRGEGWSGLLQYSSNLNWIFWVPQHAIACWLFTSLILGYSGRKKALDLASIIFAMGYSLLWSPFASLGLVPVVLVKLSRLKNLSDFRQVLSIQGLSGAILAGVSLLYFASKIDSSPYPLIPMSGGLVFNLAGEPGSISVLSMAGQPYWIVIVRVLFFILLEVGFFGLPLWILLKKDTARKRLLFGALFWLCLLPWFYFGVYNDLVMRASGSALFVLAILGLQELFVSPRWDAPRLALAAIWIMGSLAPLTTLGLQLRMGLEKDALQPVASLEDSVLNTKGLFFNTQWASQYLGGSDSFFSKVFEKKQSSGE